MGTRVAEEGKEGGNNMHGVRAAGSFWIRKAYSKCNVSNDKISAVRYATNYHYIYDLMSVK